jgi:hypothetical protein
MPSATPGGAWSPSKDSRPGVKAVRASPPTWLPLVRFDAFQSVVCGRLAGHRVPRPRLLLVVSDVSCGSYRLPSPRSFRNAVHPLLGFRPLQSASTPRPTGSAFASPAAFRGVPCPLRGISHRRRCERPPKATHHPSSAFLTPSTVSSACDLVGLFHPTATSRVHPSGVRSSHTAGPPRRRLVPSRR